MKRQYNQIFYSFFLLFYVASSTYSLKTLYGVFDITNNVLIDLLEDTYFKRLEKINQYGVDYYIFNTYSYTRAEHSKGVLALLIRYNTPLKEQIAGLLHDVSHTVFSHVGDKIFGHLDGVDSYQDTQHEWFLEQTTLPVIIKKYGITLKEINHKNSHFTCLENNLPDVCADRLEYNLMGAYLENLITSQEIETLLNHLHFEDNTWYFDEIVYARQLALLSLYLTKNIWAHPYGQWIDYWAAEALKHAAKRGVITFDEIHFSYDEALWNTLMQCKDEYISSCIETMKNYKKVQISTQRLNKNSLFLKAKFRGINPWVKTENGLQRLTELDNAVKKLYEEYKNSIEQGCYLSL